MNIRIFSFLLLATTSAHAQPQINCAKTQAPAEKTAFVVSRTVPVKPVQATVDIAIWFCLLPLEVFDDTTDGLEAEDRVLLLEKHSSDSWTFQRISARKAELRAKHGYSVVTMTLSNAARPVLNVHIQNEKVETVSRWIYRSDGKPLEKLSGK